MKALAAITDPVYVEPKEFTAYEKFWLKYMNDKRDLPFIHLLTAIHILVIPTAIILYTPFLCIPDVLQRKVWIDAALHLPPQTF